ncbi:hypothetical protein ZWY2020_038118 [Hordeum vulgare]|nr:hypothetical protein ZWY2020_038118 [Hordeum vulgare]
MQPPAQQLADADKALRCVARKTLRAMRGDLDEEADLTGSSLECGDGDDYGGSIVSDGQTDVGRPSCHLGERIDPRVGDPALRCAGAVEEEYVETAATGID